MDEMDRDEMRMVERWNRHYGQSLAAHPDCRDPDHPGCEWCNDDEEMVMTFEDLQEKIEGWAGARGILRHSTAQMQFLKAVSEMGELADGLAKDRHEEITDAVGDVLVCLINMCAILEIELVECLEGAWEEIKDRKGQMLPGGVFVKEGDSAIGGLIGD